MHTETTATTRREHHCTISRNPFGVPVRPSVLLVPVTDFILPFCLPGLFVSGRQVLQENNARINTEMDCVPARFEVRHTHYRMTAMENPYRPLLDARGRSSFDVETVLHPTDNEIVRRRQVNTTRWQRSNIAVARADFLDQAEHNRVEVAIREDRD